MRPGRVLTCVFAIACLCALARGNEPACHDPCVIKQGEYYYAFGTGRGITVNRSTDLLNWEKLPNLFPAQPDWAQREVPGTKDFWAPDISFFNGQYHLYFAISTFGSDRSCIGLTTNETLDPTSAKYKWIDHGIVIQTHHGEDWNAIDPNVALDENERPWLALGSYWSGLKLIELDPLTGMAMKDAPLISIARRPKEVAIEAPFIIRHGKFVYLFASFDGCCQGVKSNYNIRVGRAEKITGPYIDASGKSMLEGGGTMVLEGNGRFRGPGHQAILSDNGRDLLFHHFYDADDNGKAKLQIRPITWDEDGWPHAGEPINQPASKVRSLAATTAPAH
jgi:arabinan endo-1,5-alpha-L-arabinosidase